MSDLFLFLDEAGDFTFNLQASRYLVFTCLSTSQPEILAQPLANLRYRLFPQGYQLERFHAAEDKQVVRNQVFQIISACHAFELDAVIVEKRKTHPSLQSEHLYSRIYEILLRHVLKRQNLVQLRSLQVICDTVPLKRKRRAMEGSLKFQVKRLLHIRAIPFSVVFHNSGSHPFLQVVDYCGWAIFRRWERSDLRSYNLIGRSIKSEFNVFRRGTTYYY